MKQATLTVLVVTLLILHQDFWFWREARPLLFGFLPVGLWYHMLYCGAASAMMAALVKWAWPKEEEAECEVEATTASEQERSA
jgi:hypothetical protein